MRRCSAAICAQSWTSLDVVAQPVNAAVATDTQTQSFFM
jgi:hypothetical protein